MWNPFIDGDLIKDLTYKRYLDGKFIGVPTIFGDVTNGGTMYAPSNTSTLEQSNEFVRNQFPALTNSQLETLNELFINPNKTCPNVGCYWRQAANVYGEIRYLCPGLFLSELLADFDAPPSYNYWWDVLNPKANATGQGVVHVIETFALFGPGNNFQAAPDSYYPGELNGETSPIIQGYWTSFIRTLDPNKHRHNGTARWEAWAAMPESRLWFGTGGAIAMRAVDLNMRERCDYLKSIAVSLDQ